MRGQRISDKIQEFYHTTGTNSSQLALSSQPVSGQTMAFIKTNGQGSVPVQHIVQNANRNEIQSQGGVRSMHNKPAGGIVVTDGDTKRAASAYGGTQGGNRRNLIVNKQNAP